MGKGYLSWIRSNDKTIIALLEQQASMTVDAASLLTELMRSIAGDRDKSRKFQFQIRDLEKNGDQNFRKLITSIDESFITPLDREDISRLNNHIEKVLNHTRKVADKFVLFNVERPSSEMLELVIILKELTSQISGYISELRHLKKIRIILERGSIAKHHQDKAEDIYDKAISSLFGTDNSIEILRSKEIYDYLQRAISRCIDLNELLEDIALKYA